MTEKIKWYKEVLELEPNSKVFFPLARLLVEDGQDAESVEILEKGLERHPEYLEARLFLIEILHKNRQKESCAAQVKKLSDLFASYAGFWQAWAACLSSENDADTASILRFIAARFITGPLQLHDVLNRGLESLIREHEATRAKPGDLPADADMASSEKPKNQEHSGEEQPESVARQADELPMETAPTEKTAPAEAETELAGAGHTHAEEHEDDAAGEINLPEESVIPAENMSGQGEESRFENLHEEPGVVEAVAELEENDVRAPVQDKISEELPATVCSPAQSLAEDAVQAEESNSVMETSSGETPPEEEEKAFEANTATDSAEEITQLPSENVEKAEDEAPAALVAETETTIACDAENPDTTDFTEESAPELAISENTVASAPQEEQDSHTGNDSGMAAPDTLLNEEFAEAAPEDTDVASPEDSVSGDMEISTALESGADAIDACKEQGQTAAAENPVLPTAQEECAPEILDPGIALLVQDNEVDDEEDGQLEEDQSVATKPALTDSLSGKEENSEEQFSLRTKSMAEVLAEQGDTQGALDIYQELAAAASSSEEEEDIRKRMAVLRSRLNEPAIEVAECQDNDSGKERLIGLLETLARRVEARVNG